MFSMTGFASDAGAIEGWSWVWDLRSVNSKGLDIRTRIPDWIDGLDQTVRGLLGLQVGRGAVSITLRVTNDGDAGMLTLDRDHLAKTLAALAQVQSLADAQGVTLSAPSTADVLQMRGVQVSEATPSAALKPALIESFKRALVQFSEMRASEGAALQGILLDQLAQIEGFSVASDAAVEARRAHQIQSLKDTLARIAEAGDVDPDRAAQELALIAVKTDVTEELDRLRAHIKAARDLVTSSGKPVGRRMDFLCQEFNREANTLCSKAQASALTSIGLDLKVTIDQMREQIQNVE